MVAHEGDLAVALVGRAVDLVLPGLAASMELNSALESAASSRPRRSAFRVLLDICASVGFCLVWLFDTCFLGVCTFELCKARYGGPPPFAAVATLAATANAVVRVPPPFGSSFPWPVSTASFCLRSASPF